MYLYYIFMGSVFLATQKPVLFLRMPLTADVFGRRNVTLTDGVALCRLSVCVRLTPTEIGNRNG